MGNAKITITITRDDKIGGTYDGMREIAGKLQDLSNVTSDKIKIEVACDASFVQTIKNDVHEVLADRAAGIIVDIKTTTEESVYRIAPSTPIDNYLQHLDRKQQTRRATPQLPPPADTTNDDDGSIVIVQ